MVPHKEQRTTAFTEMGSLYGFVPSSSETFGADFERWEWQTAGERSRWNAKLDLKKVEAEEGWSACNALGNSIDLQVLACGQFLQSEGEAEAPILKAA